MKNTEIIKGPHLLFRGSNGRPCFGITVRSLLPKEECEGRGLQREWCINDHTILTDDGHAPFLGMTPAEFENLRQDILRLLDEDNRVRNKT